MGCRVHCALNAGLQKGKRNENDNEETDTGRDAPCRRIVSRCLFLRREGGVVRVYLDNCCYNRPFDDQSQLRIKLEAK